MAGPSTTFDELVTTTLRNHPDLVADNVSTQAAFWFMMKRKGKIKKLDGGYKIVRPLDYANNQTFQRYSGYDTLNIGASEVLSAAEFDWMQAAVNVTASGRELRMNSGDQQIIDLSKARLKNAMRTATNYMTIDVHSDGALTNQMGGLAFVIQTNGQGTVGGINSATWTFWRNQFREAAGTNTISKATIKGEMNALWLQCVRNADKPDLLVSSNDFYSMYWESLQDLQRFATPEVGAAGFQSLKYGPADIIHDVNSNFSATAEKMYFTNTDYLEICVHRDANWTQLEDKKSVNQDAVVIPLIWQGNMICSNRQLQGVLIDAA